MKSISALFNLHMLVFYSNLSKKEKSKKASCKGCFYSLTAPAPKLLIIRLWANIKNIMKGIATSIDPAANEPNSDFLSVTNPKSPRARVCFSADLKIILGKIKSIHGAVNVTMARNVMIGEATGKITLKKMVRWLAPSILADSSRLLV